MHLSDLDAPALSPKTSPIRYFFTVIWILTSPLIIGASIPIVLAINDYSSGFAFIVYIVYTIVWLAFHAFLLDREVLAI